jgi:hypothetical protein
MKYAGDLYETLFKDILHKHGFRYGAPYDYTARARQKVTLTIHLDDFPDGTAQRIIKILLDNGLDISKYDIDSRMG